MMNRIYLDAKDKYVGNYVFYGNSEDNKLYYESAHEHQVTEADLVDAFMKGALISPVGHPERIGYRRFCGELHSYRPSDRFPFQQKGIWTLRTNRTRSTWCVFQ